MNIRYPQQERDDRLFGLLERITTAAEALAESDARRHSLVRSIEVRADESVQALLENHPGLLGHFSPCEGGGEGTGRRDEDSQTASVWSLDHEGLLLTGCDDLGSQAVDEGRVSGVDVHIKSVDGDSAHEVSPSVGDAEAGTSVVVTPSVGDAAGPGAPSSTGPAAPSVWESGYPREMPLSIGGRVWLGKTCLTPEEAMHLAGELSARAVMASEHGRKP